MRGQVGAASVGIHQDRKWQQQQPDLFVYPGPFPIEASDLRPRRKRIVARELGELSREWIASGAWYYRGFDL